MISVELLSGLAPGVAVNVAGIGTDTPSRDAEFLGIMFDEHDDAVAVVRYVGHGILLAGVHPSRVRLAR